MVPDADLRKSDRARFSPGRVAIYSSVMLGLRQPLKTEARMFALARGFGLADGGDQVARPHCPRRRT